MQDLQGALKKYWGYDSFRPLQERIIHSLMSGRDAAVVMPTGGGKSLCYQLPALALAKTVVVISPLIALMQDQVAQLADMGIPAAVLNSAQPPEEQRTVMRAAVQGAYRLLYLSPERLARQDTITWLKRVPLAFFAIDEAHCISEWGHEFRPEYRQLSSLRQNFPEMPIAAFTASATRRVRQDILDQLQLRDPDKYIASFHRANLRYIVEQCDKETHRRRLMAAIKAYEGESVIVYAPTIAEVERTVDYLEDRRMAAVPYHGQMETAVRRRNQEAWMNDEVRVLVGTVAFGLGINKPAVRAVIHTSMPKSIEQYYQEAGRAGRDGLPADCVLLWQPKDAGLLAYFIEQLSDPAEKDRAWQRYHTIRNFVESPRCRHFQVCLHFGQTPKWQRCEMCDVCGNLPEWMKVAVEEAPAKTRRAAKKTQRVAAPPSEAPRPVEPPAERPRTELSPRPPVPTPPSRPQPARATGETADLMEFFKEWRRRTAARLAVPAYVVLSDAALEDLCRKQPTNLRELLAVYGFGERKAELYGSEIFSAFEAFRKGARAAARAAAQVSPAEETMRLLAEGKSFEEIAVVRSRQVTTVVQMVADLVEKGRVAYNLDWVGAENHARILEAIAAHGSQWLKPLREALPAEITYEQIRLVVAFARKESSEDPSAGRG
ncbi:MAG TPA: RecQ family ATP-dependent DNA helicase [Bryobacteraceae bacterium]|nr:RecQ family ATP-dependent DNA helicase [Bryobacteraceae bacterium]